MEARRAGAVALSDPMSPVSLHAPFGKAEASPDKRRVVITV
jgi:hypothetical protein